MKRSLRKLSKLMPPPKGQRHTNVNWQFLEEHVGLSYPTSFKEFVSIYGSSHWFDKLLPFYSQASRLRDVTEYLKSIDEKLKYLINNMYDEKYNELAIPLYPTQGGLLPFMADIDGPLYCWHTKSINPNNWPVYCWMRGVIVILEKTTIADMMLAFLERSPQMIGIWGDVQDYDPERIRIDDVCSDE